MMGSPENEAGRFSSEIQHRVQLTQDYEIQATEVTQKQYFDVMGVNPSQFKNLKNYPKTYQAIPNGFVGCPNNPVEKVSYNDVQAFITKLNSQRGEGFIYRLPTEAEWEYSARAGTSTVYSFGNDPRQLAHYGWFAGNSGNQTHEVAKLKPNILGLYDMHGNVWEWVSDYFAEYDSVGPGNPQINPVGPSSGSGRVYRGGPDGRSEGLGFRLVRTK